jgi:hypothetical protein
VLVEKEKKIYYLFRPLKNGLLHCMMTTTFWTSPAPRKPLSTST